MIAPDSSYSVLVIYLSSKPEILKRIGPLIYVLNFLSGEEITLISSFIDSGAKMFDLFC